MSRKSRAAAQKKAAAVVAPSTVWRDFLLLAAGVIALVAVVRWFYLIDQHAVNIPFWDQWDFLNAFFQPNSWLDIFRWQHGPHRQGAGFLLTLGFYELTGWDTRLESFLIGFLMLLAALVALDIKRRLWGRLNWTDALIPALFLTPYQWEIFGNANNLSLNAFPILLVMLYARAWLMTRPYTRLVLLLTLNLLLIYSGFGLFMGVLTVLAFLFELCGWWGGSGRVPRPVCALGLLIAVLELASFFVGYTFNPATDNFTFPVEGFWYKYPLFITMLLSFCVGVFVPASPYLMGVVGGVVLLGLVFFLAMCMIRSFSRNDAQNAPGLKSAAEGARFRQVLFMLCAFSGVFAVNCAIGRISLGYMGGAASRYIPFITPALLAVYFYLCQMQPGRIRKYLLPALVCAYITGTLCWTLPPNAKLISDVKRTWAQQYLQCGSAAETIRLTRATVHPAPEATQLERKMGYLREHQLAFFHDLSAEPPAVDRK